MFGFSKFRKVRQQIESGQLSEATAVFLGSHLQDHYRGPELAERLAQSLMSRAQSHALRSDFLPAWQDLAHAERLFDAIERSIPSQLMRQRQELVELVVEAAEGHLAAGRPVQALRVVAELRRRHILDSRADRIELVANRIHEAERLATQGHWSRAIQEYERVLAQRPDLAWLGQRQQALAQQNMTAGSLTNRLRQAMQESRWSTARQVSSQLLAIAPHLQIAADALRRSMKRQGPPVVMSAPVKLDASLTDTSARKFTETDIRLAAPGNDDMKRFMLWVDGVGGYLLCVDPTAVLGRALPDAGIEIPIQGDLRRRHLRIERTGSDYLATPLADVQSDGANISDPIVLRSGQRLSLGPSVQLEFAQPHPLSATAKLRLVSRHRTQPWSDAVLLVADTLVIGPSPSSHVVCPELDSEIVLICRNGTWSIRSAGNLEVDGKVLSGSSDLNGNCRVTGEGISMSLEAIS